MANPTTNYGFVLPTSTDLVTDLPADFDVALQGVDTRLKALQPGTTLGDLVYSSATANTNTRLGIGTTGQILTVASGVPAWSTPAASSAKVIQVISATTTTATTVSGTTYADTTLTASITPTLSTSKILVITMQSSEVNGSTNASYGAMRLMRGATAIWTSSDEQFGFYVAGASSATTEIRFLANVVYMDSPATTSATTYKTQVKGQFSNQNFKTQIGSTSSTIILMEIGA